MASPADNSSFAHSDTVAEPSNLPRSRYIPAAVRRAVFELDQGGCTFVDSNGRRCSEESYLELHHLQPFALHGAHVTSNLTLRCRAHNALAAEDELGRAFVARKQQSLRHEPLVAQTKTRGS